MPNIIHIGPVDNAAELLNAGAYGSGALIQVQSSATEAGAYANISGTGSTPTIAIVATTYSYTAYDPAGTASTWYRYRFENSGGTITGDWATAAQTTPSDGLLCSLNTVKRRLNLITSAAVDSADDSLLLQFMSDATSMIQGFTERKFIRSPISGTSTFYFDVAKGGRVLKVPVGISTLTTLEVATQSQPASGGTFSTVTAADVLLRPVSQDRMPGFPATEIHITDRPTGAISSFYVGYNTARVVGALGFDAVPTPIADIAANVAIRRFVGRGTGVLQTVGNDEIASVRLLRWLSPEEKSTLTWYRAL